jgi:hypothetical protein
MRRAPDRLITRDPGPRAARVARRAMRRAAMAERVARDAAARVWHPGHGHGTMVCATSPHADGAPRVIVAWDDGTEGKVCETELRAPPLP